MRERDALRTDGTIVDRLRARAEAHADRIAFIRWADRRDDERHVTYGTVDGRARAVAAGLQARGLAGERVLVLVGPGLDYVTAFFGCLYAGAVAVPYYPPTGLGSADANAAHSRHSRVIAKLRAIVQAAQPAAILSQDRGRTAASVLADGGTPVDSLTVDELLLSDATRWTPPAGGGDALALLQFTSGSTGSPRGVMLTHANLVYNSECIRSAFAQEEHGVVVSWLPPFHDMGLIGGILQPMYTGGRCVLMTPAEFLQRPRRWLEAIERHHADTSGGPNFSFDLCVRRIPADERAGLRLSSWTMAFTGAEPIRPDTLTRFADAFAAAGFQREAFFPCYGLAEGTLAVTASRRMQGPVVAEFDRAALERNEAIPPADSPKAVVGCGTIVGDQQLVIVDQATHGELPPYRVGDVWVRGPSVAAGYWQQADATAETFGARLASGEGPFLRTGDLGFVDDAGQLFIVGRRRDLIIIRGTNHHPADIEATVERSHLVLRSGGCAAFGVAADDGEQLVIVAEIEPRSGPARDGRHDPAALAAITSVIRAAVLEGHEVDPSAVLLVVAGSVPRTTSGKIERYACRERYRHHAFAVVHAWHHQGDAPRHDPVEHRRPRTDVERHVAAIWAEVLGTAEPSLDDHFFEAGGQSLLALELVDRLSRATGAEIPLRALLDHATLEALAAFVARAPRSPRESDPLDVRPDERFEPFPLTEVQEAYLFGRSTAFELGGVATQGVAEFDARDLDVPRLARAVDRLVQRHDMLRAVVTADGRQTVLGHVPPFDVEVRHLENHAAAAQADALEQLRRELGGSMLPTDRWPLFQIVVCTLGDGRCRVFARFDLLIADLHSLRSLWRELGARYADPDAALPDVQTSFRDAVLHLRRTSRDAEFERSRQYWQRRLPALPPAPELPYVTAFRAIGVPAFRRRTIVLEGSAWARLQEQAARAHVTPTAVLLAAFSEVLATWSRHPRFTLTLTYFNRPRLPGIDDVVGDFTSLLLVAIESAADSFHAAAQRVQQELWEVLDHRQAGGVHALRELARLQGRTAHALMPVVFTSAIGHEPSGRTAPWAWLGELVGGCSSTPQVALDHQVQEDGDRLLLTWDTVDALFPDGMLDEMFGAYRALLDQLAARGASWTAPMPVVVPQAHRALVSEVNRTVALLEPATLHGLFLRQAIARPQQIGVITADGATLTYEQIERRSRAVAHWIGAEPPSAGELVAIVMRKGWAQVVAALGVVRAGAAYLPIDPALPEERRHYLLERGRVRQVLTEGDVDARLDWPGHVRRCHVDALEPAADDIRAVDPSDWTRLAYVIFTSGSTGQPKGVMIDHRGAVNTIVDLNARFGIGPADRVLGLSALGFDLSVYDVFGTLAAGGTLVLPRPGTERDPDHWLQLVRAHGVTLWNSVPALFEMFTDVQAGRDRPDDALRLVWMSGDWIPVTLPDRARAQRPGLEIISMGGATEGSIWSILYPIRSVDPTWRSIPYGRPLANQHMHVFDHRLRPRPAGVTGDIHIGGVGVALGYWRDPERTSASFLTHPSTGERLYRAGDLGRWLRDGNIEFLGRDDGQVKIGGLRIELGEIEAALAAHPDVRLCAVVARHLTGAATTDASAASKRRLVAFVLPHDGHQVAEAALRAWLEQKLPSAMVPTRIVSLTSMPLSANGKVDVNALTVPTLATSRLARRVTADEARVRALWADALAVDEDALGPDDNFFDVGGTSIALVQLARGLSAAAGREVPLLALFEQPTIAGMARLLSGAATEDPSVDHTTARAARRKQQLSSRRRTGTERPRPPG